VPTSNKPKNCLNKIDKITTNQLSLFHLILEYNLVNFIKPHRCFAIVLADEHLRGFEVACVNRLESVTDVELEDIAANFELYLLLSEGDVIQVIFGEGWGIFALRQVESLLICHRSHKALTCVGNVILLEGLRGVHRDHVGFAVFVATLQSDEDEVVGDFVEACMRVDDLHSGEGVEQFGAADFTTLDAGLHGVKDELSAYLVLHQVAHQKSVGVETVLELFDCGLLPYGFCYLLQLLLLELNLFLCALQLLPQSL
jgi:hypothetical protein